MLIFHLLLAGIVGDSNAQCFNSKDTTGNTGSQCTYDADCLYGQCANRLCVAPALSCQSSAPGMYWVACTHTHHTPWPWLLITRTIITSSPGCSCLVHLILHSSTVLYSSGSVCSGNGACKYLDPSGNVLSSCSILDVTCTAACVCSDTYGGKDCSLKSSVLGRKDSMRWEIWASVFAHSITCLLWCVYPHSSIQVQSLTPHLYLCGILNRNYYKSLANNCPLVSSKTIDLIF